MDKTENQGELFTPEPKRKRRPSSEVPKSKSKAKPTILKSIAKLYDILVSKEFALILFLMVQIGQTFHSTYVMHLLSGMNGIASWVFAAFVSIGIDLIIVNLVGRGNEKAAIGFGFYYFAVNLYAFYTNDHVSWNNFNGYFVIIPSFFIPFAAHQLSVEMGRKKIK